jgi:Uri superfamily endonuclease
VGTVPGTYVLVLYLSHKAYLRVAHLGTHLFRAGYYCYVGSARGPGGLRARLSRHLRQQKKPHWHIDYLLPRAAVVEIWAAPSTERLECLCVQTLLSMPGAEIVVHGFGSSDCRCDTHLVYFSASPSVHDFRGRLRSSTPGVPLFTTHLQR